MFFAKKILGSKDILYLGNLNAKRDGVMQRLYRNAMENLQQSKPDDYVIATGKLQV